jgi:hypothetical protein
MSRSGYSDWGDWEGREWELIRWRGAVASAIRGARGQAFLREMLSALDALPRKCLVANSFVQEEEEVWVCAIASVARARGVDLSDIDPGDDQVRYPVAARLGIAPALAAEIMWENDEGWPESSEQRFARVRMWIASQIKE